MAFTEGVKLYEIRYKLVEKLKVVEEAIKHLEGR